jgi:hypothetical protein
MRFCRITIILGFGMSLLLMACTPTTPDSTSVEITYPVEGTKVEQTEAIKGVSRLVPEGQEIWILVVPQRADRYYPHNRPADVLVNGGWHSLANIGITEDVGDKFDILVVLVDGDAQDVFEDYLREAEEKKDWPGLEQLPDGAVIYDRITVTRK